MISGVKQVIDVERMMDEEELLEIERLAVLHLPPQERTAIWADVKRMLRFVSTTLAGTVGLREAARLSVEDKAVGGESGQPAEIEAAGREPRQLAEVEAAGEEERLLTEVVFRADVETESLSEQESLRNAAAVRKGFFIVPRVVKQSLCEESDEGTAVRCDIGGVTDCAEELRMATTGVERCEQRSCLQGTPERVRGCPGASGLETAEQIKRSGLQGTPEKVTGCLGASALETAGRIKRGELRVTAVVEACLAQIARAEPDYNCLITTAQEQALAQAEVVQRRLATGELSWSPLAGIPVLVKDNINIKGMQTSCASKMLAGYASPYDATAVELMKEAGMIVLGKANLDEFAMGSTTETSYFGLTRNPWNQERIPGGSSGGSTAAVALHEAYCALGTDTGGSIRLPAAYCGVVGIKPTYGAISRYGMTAFASSCDQIGPIARTVADCAALFSVLARRDAKDQTSRTIPMEPVDGRFRFSGCRIGIPDGVGQEESEPAVAAAMRRVTEVLRALGAEVEEVRFPDAKQTIALYKVISCSEAASNLARYDGIRYGFHVEQPAAMITDNDTLELFNQREENEAALRYAVARGIGFGAEVKRRILFGTYCLLGRNEEISYERASRLRDVLRAQVGALFQASSLLVCPVTPYAAPLISEGGRHETPQDGLSFTPYTAPLISKGGGRGTPQDGLSFTPYTAPSISKGGGTKQLLLDCNLSFVNLCGLPALCLPCGRDENGVPIGIQLIGAPCSDYRLLSAARQLEQALAE